MNHICFTALNKGADLAAEIATGPGKPRGYVVEPEGEFENDRPTSTAELNTVKKWPTDWRCLRDAMEHIRLANSGVHHRAASQSKA